jgi:cation:H+ antiporter
MALMNMVSSNINQWTILAAMIPLVYGFSHLHHHGDWASFTFDAEQRLEIVLTLLQTLLGAVLLAELEFDARDASALFVLWLAQFLVPHWREEVAVAYGIWIVALLLAYVVGKKRMVAPRYFWEIISKKPTGRDPR